MKKSATLKKILLRKVTTAVLVTASLASFATLGNGGGKKASHSLLTTNYTEFTHFTLRPSYLLNNNVNLNTVPARFVLMNTDITYQKGNATYILPMKRRVVLDKIKIGTGNIY